MHTIPTADALARVDAAFLEKVAAGDRLFHYSCKGTARESFEKSPSAEYTLFSVIDVPDEDDVVIVGAFDEKEVRRHVSRSDLLAGDWWYSPADGHR